MSRRALAAVATAAVFLAVVAVAAAVALLFRSGGGGDDLARLSNRGRPADLAVAGQGRARGGKVRLLAIREGHAFYRTSMDGVPCFGIGRFSPTRGVQPGVGGCTQTFPTPAEPILDESPIEDCIGCSGPHYVRVEGFAADGVAEVGVAEESGRIGARIPVVDNVYHLAALPDGDFTRIFAFDAEGDVVARIPR